MKSFTEIREKVNVVSSNMEMTFTVPDKKRADIIRNELSNLVDANFNVTKNNSNYQIKIMPKTNDDRKIISSFLSDVEVELLKNEFIRGMSESRDLGEKIILNTISGDAVDILPYFFDKIATIHDTLHEDNQEIFMEMLVHSSETFEQAMNFCETMEITNNIVDEGALKTGARLVKNFGRAAFAPGAIGVDSLRLDKMHDTVKAAMKKQKVDKEEFEFNGKIYPVVRVQQEIKSVDSDLNPSSLRKLKVKMAGVNKVTAKDPMYDTIKNIINGANKYELQDIVDADINILSHAANLYLNNHKKYADIIAYRKDLTKE